jgi:hypothetical protein
MAVVDAGPLYTMQLQSATCAKRSRILVLDEAIIASHGDLPLHLRQFRIVIRRALKFHLCRITRKNRQGRHPALLNKWILNDKWTGFPRKPQLALNRHIYWECTLICRLLERWCPWKRQTAQPHSLVLRSKNVALSIEVWKAKITKMGFRGSESKVPLLVRETEHNP